MKEKQLRMPLGNLIAGNRTGEELDKGAQMVLQACNGWKICSVFRYTGWPSAEHMRISGFNQFNIFSSTDT